MLTLWSPCSRILESGLFANIEVTCADTGKTFKVHKSVLCERSRYFKSALTGGYEVSDFRR